jgi:uncharacterized protein
VIDELTYLTSVEELRPPYLPPSALMRAWQLDRLDRHCCEFTAHAPLVIIGSPRPWCQCQRRCTALCISSIHSISLFRIGPATTRHDGKLACESGNRPSVRHSGHRGNAADQWHFAPHAFAGSAPIDVGRRQSAEAHDRRDRHGSILPSLHKPLKRSRLRHDDDRLDRAKLPSLGQMISDQAVSADITLKDIDARIEIDARKNLHG